MKKFLLVLMTLALLVPSMALAKDVKPGFEVKKATTTVGGFKVAYPEVTKILTTHTNELAVKNINDDVLKKVMSNVVPLTQFKANKIMDNNAAGTVTYKVTCNRGGLLSVLMETKVILKGDQGKTQVVKILDGLNYSSSGQKIVSQDVTKLDVLAHEPDQFGTEYINAKIDAAHKAGKLVVKKNFKGIAPKDTYNFYFDKDTNVIAIFNPGEVGDIDSAPQTMSLEK